MSVVGKEYEKKPNIKMKKKKKKREKKNPFIDQLELLDHSYWSLD